MFRSAHRSPSRSPNKYGLNLPAGLTVTNLSRWNLYREYERNYARPGTVLGNMWWRLTGEASLKLWKEKMENMVKKTGLNKSQLNYWAAKLAAAKARRSPSRRSPSRSPSRSPNCTGGKRGCRLPVTYGNMG